eukprot:3228494-Alexandrium_andersonii.AAC.1
MAQMPRRSGLPGIASMVFTAAQRQYLPTPLSMPLPTDSDWMPTRSWTRAGHLAHLRRPARAGSDSSPRQAGAR